MKENRSSLFVILLCMAICLPLNETFAQKQKSKISPATNITTTGAQDREYWSNLLYKMVAPVIENLSAGTLKKNMPLEKAPGYGLNAAKVTYLEVVGRTVAGVAPWLALPDDETKEGVLRKKLRNSLLKGL